MRAPGSERAGSALSPGRAFVVYALGAALVGGTALEVTTDERHWPFSEYPMYSKIAGPDFRRPVVYGVGAGGEEIPLLERDYLHPLSAEQVRQTMRRLLREGEPELRLALLDLARRYEAGRSQGRHDGPPLVALRLYDCFWDTRDDDRPGPPERRELLFQAALPVGPR